MVRLTRVGRPRVEDNLSVDSTRIRIPVGRLAQVRNLFQIVDDGQQLRKNVVNVSGTLQNVSQHDMQSVSMQYSRKLVNACDSKLE